MLAGLEGLEPAFHGDAVMCVIRRAGFQIELLTGTENIQLARSCGDGGLKSAWIVGSAVEKGVIGVEQSSASKNQRERTSSGIRGTGLNPTGDLVFIRPEDVARSPARRDCHVRWPRREPKASQVQDLAS